MWWTLFGIYLAGVFATAGALKGISIVEKTEPDNEVFFKTVLQSWYSFGILMTLMITEIGEKIENKGE